MSTGSWSAICSEATSSGAGVAGFSDEFDKGFAQVMQSGIANIAATNAAPITAKVSARIRDAAAAARREGNPDAVALQDLVHHLDGRRQQEVKLDSQSAQALYRRVSDYAGLVFLGDISYSLINALQVPTLGAPHLAAKYGWTRTTMQLTKALGDLIGVTAGQMRSVAARDSAGMALRALHRFARGQLDPQARVVDVSDELSPPAPARC